MTDLYQRPDRDEIARQVNGTLPRADRAETADAAPAPQPQPDVLACFSEHLRARMRALAWTQESIQERAGVTAIIAAKAVNGTGVSLAFAGQLAALVGLTLPQMLGSYECGTCGGTPPAGFTCQECETEGTRL